MPERIMKTLTLKPHLLSFWTQLKLLGTRAGKHDILNLSAALAYYTALSLAPLLLITVSVIGLLRHNSQEHLINQVNGVIGRQAGEAMEVIIKGAKDRPDLLKSGHIFGIVSLRVAASGVWAFIRKRILSMGMVFKFLPDKMPPWRFAVMGGAITALLFAIGKTLIVFLVWVYYSSLILFIGAEITGLLTHHQEEREGKDAAKLPSVGQYSPTLTSATVKPQRSGCRPWHTRCTQ